MNNQINTVNKTNTTYKLNANEYVKALYQAVDNKDVDYLDTVLSEQVNFRIGNNATITDKATALAANAQFFSSIESMSHTIDNVWEQGQDIICNGTVDYVRLDGTPHTAYFSTVLTVTDQLIKDYFVYADLSQL